MTTAYLKVLGVGAPGSYAAKAAGCLCAVLDNAHGRGAYIDPERGPQFWITEGCLLHDVPTASPPVKAPFDPAPSPSTFAREEA